MYLYCSYVMYEFCSCFVQYSSGLSELLINCIILVVLHLLTNVQTVLTVVSLY